MEESLYLWKSEIRVTQFIEQVRKDLSEYNDKSSVAVNLFLDRNYGFIVKTAEVLNESDHNLLYDFFVQQLVDIGYKVNRKYGEETMLQASVRDRVNGNQMYGTIKVVKKASEVRVLITPYIDSGYNTALKRRELIDLLFT